MIALNIAVACVLSIAVTCSGYNLVQSFQLFSYKPSRYFYGLKRILVFQRAIISVLTVITAILFNVLFESIFWSYIGLIPLIALSVAFFFMQINKKQKTPLIFTPRVIRLISIIVLVNTCIICPVLFAIEISKFWILLLPLLPLAMTVVIVIAHYIGLPVEKLIAKRFITQAKAKLARINPVNICITGSYGKTSVKFILDKMLSKKYRVCCPPRSYNTSMGLCRVVNEQLKDNDEILLAEMGAKSRGHIASLCSIVKPAYAVITGITEQHMSTFKTIENLQDTKFELVEALDEEGTAVFNGACEKVMPLYERAACKKYLVSHSVDNAYASISGVSVSINGTDFNLIIDGKVQKCHTALLGAHNAENIALAAAVAHMFGVSMDDIAEVAGSLTPVEHRLNIIQNGAFTILDDSFSSNPAGSRAALDVLEDFPKPRIIVTPGIIEGGAEQARLNAELGAYIAGRADIAIFTGVNKHALRSGAAGGKNPPQILFADTLDDAVKMLPDIVFCGTVLFENDLPDNL